MCVRYTQCICCVQTEFLNILDLPVINKSVCVNMMNMNSIQEANALAIYVFICLLLYAPVIYLY